MVTDLTSLQRCYEKNAIVATLIFNLLNISVTDFSSIYFDNPNNHETIP